MARLARLPLAAAAALTLSLSAATPALAAPPAHAAPHSQATTTAPASAGVGKGAAKAEAFSFGVIGDVPYGAAQVARFPGMIDELAAQRDLEFLAHVGDIKAGSAVCSDEYFRMIRAEVDRLTMPFILTPGDNDWTDCHRANNGSYDPLERLQAFRDVFYPRADRADGGADRRGA
ncbi:hypothetical protein [Micrococcus sp.]|uniref:hypothetical protein n=1 Tax=Micrococcus sp. TaxID=1271 RepID=UPI002A9177CC|nr:hypothetical protein [Micrococcus sp.]MDY6055013.1 hypothetical protein [Micrococcus sp.]